MEIDILIQIWARFDPKALINSMPSFRSTSQISARSHSRGGGQGRGSFDEKWAGSEGQMGGGRGPNHDDSVQWDYIHLKHMYTTPPPPHTHTHTQKKKKKKKKKTQKNLHQKIHLKLLQWFLPNRYRYA